LESLFQKYKDDAAFLFVYIREAHPADGWQMDSNKTDNVVFDQPTVFGERQSVAQTCCSRLSLSMPCVVDSIDNQVDGLYASWPERIFVVEDDGKIAYAGKQGPWGFKPQEAEQALRRALAKRGKWPEATP
jgi:Iodothyronine deiodinase